MFEEPKLLPLPPRSSGKNAAAKKNTGSQIIAMSTIAGIPAVSLSSFWKLASSKVLPRSGLFGEQVKDATTSSAE